MRSGNSVSADIPRLGEHAIGSIAGYTSDYIAHAIVSVKGYMLGTTSVATPTASASKPRCGLSVTALAEH